MEMYEFVVDFRLSFRERERERERRRVRKCVWNTTWNNDVTIEYKSSDLPDAPPLHPAIGGREYRGGREEILRANIN
jgi:hypothetical protein